jgi:DNA-binding NarL/FixJ family response regulator
MRAQAIEDVIQAIEAIADPGERAKAATDALKVLHDGNAALAATRRESVLELRAQGQSLRTIGTALGIYHSRVQQIIAGEPTGTGVPGRKKKAEGTSAPEGA